MSGGATVLLIDDEAGVRRAFGRVLESAGFRLLFAEDGASGLAKLRDARPHAVLVDLHMPGLTGLDVLTEAARTSPDTPIIVVSGSGNVDDVVQALRRGAWGYVTKPVQEPSLLVQAVRRALEKAALVRENREQQGRVLYADHDRVHVLRYVGDVRYPLAPSVSGFIDSLFDRMDADDLVVDLSETEAIDSTNLGEIARIADLMSARGSKRAAIISTRPEISQLLFSKAFDEVFDICTEPTAANATTARSSVVGGKPIPTVDASRDASLRTILSAHRRLMQMSESNRKQFCEVVELMERDLGASSSGAKSM